MKFLTNRSRSKGVLPSLSALIGGILLGMTAGCDSSNRSENSDLPKSFSLCSGDLTALKLSFAVHENVSKVCIDDNGTTAQIRILETSAAGEAVVVVISGVMERKQSDERLSYRVDDGANSLYDIDLQKKFVIRNEGVLAIHYTGGVTVRKNGGETGRIDDLHFYSESPGAEPEWSYKPPTGPDDWGFLLPDYEICIEGKAQSPINLSRDVWTDASLKTLLQVYQSDRVSLVNNGHSLQANVVPGSFVTIKGEEYQLLQFHLHVPSEHTIDGKSADFELHMVHQSADGELAVIGVLGVKAESGNDTLAAIVKAFPEEENQPVEYAPPVDPSVFLTSPNAYVTYSGSLTTPPCSEAVTWVLLEKPILATSETISTALRKIGVENIRHLKRTEIPTQALNGREPARTAP